MYILTLLRYLAVRNDGDWMGGGRSDTEAAQDDGCGVMGNRIRIAGAATGDRSRSGNTARSFWQRDSFSDQRIGWAQ